MRAEAALPFSRRDIAACGALLCLGALVYVNALHNPFVYDDFRTVVANDAIRHPGHLHDLLMRDATRPLVNASYALDYAMWGIAPFGYHLTNLLLHLLNVVLLYGLTRAAMVDADPAVGSVSAVTAALASAGLLAVHPLMTEAVGYVSSRSEVLCATWMLLAVVAARQWMRRRGAGSWMLTMALWLAGLLTKEVAVVLPLLLIAYDRLILRSDPARWRERFKRLYLPMLIAAALAGAVRLVVLFGVERPGELSLAWRSVATQMDVAARYLALLLDPAGQAIFHAVNPVASIFAPRVLASIISAAVILCLAWWCRRRAPAAGFGVIWFVLALIPSSLLAASGLAEPMAEHRVYLAACGLFLTAGALVAWAAARLAPITRSASWLPQVAIAAVLLPLGTRTVLRNEVWGSPIALWQEAVARSPGAAFPLVVLGESLHDAGRHADAVTVFTQAIALDPNADSTYLRLGLCLSELGRFHEAAAAFEDLARRRPDSTVVTTGQGMVALLSGDSAKARALFLATLGRDRQDVAARQWLAVLEEEAGHPSEALRWCEEALTLVPGDVSTLDCIRRNRAKAGK